MQETFKQAMSRFATGVCVVTYHNPKTNEIDGVTISAFSSLSLSPLKILFCIGNMGKSYEILKDVKQFSVNILSSKQKELAYQFAGQNRENLADVITDTGGVPMIKDCLANVICDKGNSYAEGDHDIVIGNVKNILLADTDNADIEPLLYYQSAIIEDYQHNA